MDDANDRIGFDRTVRGAFAVLIGQMLPAAASGRGWPVWTPDGFERILLDHALGEPWETALPPPLSRGAASIDLMVAIEMGERLLEGSACVVQLNRRSLAMRAKLRPLASGPDPCQQAVTALLGRAGAAQRTAPATSRRS